MLPPPSRLARAPRSSHQLVTWRSAAALTPPPPRARRPRPQSAGVARRLPPEQPETPEHPETTRAPASCGLSTQQAPPRTPRRSPPDEPARGWTRPSPRSAPPGMFCTPRGSYSASSLLTAQRAGQRELAARAEAAEAAVLAAERTFFGAAVLSPDTLRLLDPSRDRRAARTMYSAGVRGTEERGRPYHEQGDPAMYTAESLAAREALRSVPIVIDAVARFSQLYRLDADGFVPWSEYRRVHAAAALILAPGVPPREVDAALAEDWTRDRAGATQLDYSRLYSAVFELADHWSGIDA